MAEYIEREALLHAMKMDVRPPFAVVRDFPAADVVEVVRCGECKFYSPVEGDVGDCEREDILYLNVNKADFCSYGERKGGLTMYEKLVDRLRCPNIHSCPMDKSKISCRQCQKGAIKEAVDAISKLQSELEQVKRERDEAISCLRYSGECYGCLYAVDNNPCLCRECNLDESSCESCLWSEDPCEDCLVGENWEWKGAKEDKK